MSKPNGQPQNVAERLAWLETLSPERRALEGARLLLPEYGEKPRPDSSWREVDPDDHYIEPWVAAGLDGITEITEQPQEMYGAIVVGHANYVYIGTRRYGCEYVEGRFVILEGFHSDHGGFLDHFMQPSPGHGTRAHGWFRPTPHRSIPYTIEARNDDVQRASMRITGNNWEYDELNEGVAVRLTLPRPGTTAEFTRYQLSASVSDGVTSQPRLVKDKPQDPNGSLLAYSVSRDAPAEVAEGLAIDHFWDTHDRVEFDSDEGRLVLGAISGIAEKVLRAKAS